MRNYVFSELHFALLNVVKWAKKEIVHMHMVWWFHEEKNMENSNVQNVAENTLQ